MLLPTKQSKVAAPHMGHANYWGLEVHHSARGQLIKLVVATDAVAGDGSQLASISVPNEEPNRYALRNLLFSSPGIENYISGVVSRFREPVNLS